jgi:hypothetical protein
METRRAGWKILVGVLALLGAWWLLLNLADSIAVWRFLADGVVPGLDRRISPDMILALVPIIFLLSTALIFRREISRAFRRPRLSRSPTATNEVRTMAEVIRPAERRPIAQPVVVPQAPRRPSLAARLLMICSKSFLRLKTYTTRQGRRAVQAYFSVGLQKKVRTWAHDLVQAPVWGRLAAQAWRGQQAMFAAARSLARVAARQSKVARQKIWQIVQAFCRLVGHILQRLMYYGWPATRATIAFLIIATLQITQQLVRAWHGVQTKLRQYDVYHLAVAVAREYGNTAGNVYKKVRSYFKAVFES